MKTTEQPSRYNRLEQLSTRELLYCINQEDETVPAAIAKALPQIEALVETLVPRLLAGGRLFYLGAGTSGRLGIVDASEIPPTYGMPHGVVVGLIAGGDTAIRKAVEFAEDDTEQGWRDLEAHQIDSGDSLIGISASGTTPYVLGAVKIARQHNVLTSCIVCNSGSPIAAAVDLPIEVVVGPEFVTGSTRMKAGTAQKLVLNMISTACMIRLGRVQGNKMVDMQLTNHKLVDRGTRYVMDATGLPYDAAQALLQAHGSVRAAIQFQQSMNSNQQSSVG